MERCCNTEALNRYMDEQDREERRYEDYLDELDEAIGELVDDIIHQHKCITNKHNFTYETLIDYINRR